MDDHSVGDAGRSVAAEVDSRPVRAPAHDVLDTFGRARPMTVGNAGRVPGSTVKVTGRAVPGPGGALRAPLSGVECVWYRSVVVWHERGTRRYPTRDLVPMNSITPSDSPSYTALHVGGTRQPRASDRSSTTPFALDDGTGAIDIEPAAIDIDTDVFAINEVVHVDDPARDTNMLGYGGGPFDQQELHVEWIIPVGAPLLAVGTVAGTQGSPMLVRGESDVVLVSTKPEQQVLSRNRAAVDPTAPHLPIRSPRSVLLIVGAVTAVAFVVVIALVVLFVVRP